MLLGRKFECELLLNLLEQIQVVLQGDMGIVLKFEHFENDSDLNLDFFACRSIK